MNEARAVPRAWGPAQRRPRNNRVWIEFLDTFYVNRRFDGGDLLEVKEALGRCLEPLKQMAEEENWGQNNINLVNYFVHTFDGLHQAQTREPNKRYIVRYNDWIYFNTGLITEEMEPIYAAFKRNTGPGAKGNDTKPQYSLILNPNNFMRDVDMTRYCNPLPDRCRYFDDYTLLIMDATKTPAVAWGHIINENWKRICRVLYPGQNIDDDNFRANHRYDAQTRLHGALMLALNRVHANYRTAVPQSYKGEIQLLLPLCINRPNVPDLVLTVSRVDLMPPVPGMFTYTARTILTLAMAYQNARLLARPEKDWLLAPVVVTEADEDYEDND